MYCRSGYQGASPRGSLIDRPYTARFPCPEPRTGIPHLLSRTTLLNPKYYHTPIAGVTPRNRCPVCHQSVYSRAGIHPQCAMIQAEPPRSKSKKQAAPAAAQEPEAPVPEAVPGVEIAVGIPTASP